MNLIKSGITFLDERTLLYQVKKILGFEKLDTILHALRI